MSKVKWPFGIADSVAEDYAATIAVSIENTKTFLTIAQLTGAATLNLTPSPEQKAGDELIVQVSADGTNRVLTWGTSMSGNAHTNTASKSFIHRFVYDGTNFVHTSVNQLN
jgi:hypothetical protein